MPLARGALRHNSVMVLDGGKVTAERHKVDLPNYGEFDEKRVFHEGPMPGPVDFRGIRLGIPVCEDIWGDLGVCETLAESGAEILLVPNGSPYYRGKIDIRHQVVIRQVIESDLPILYANQLGGQDELVFDGASFAFNADRKLAFQMSQFEEQVTVTTWRRGEESWFCDEGPMSRIPDGEEADYRACMLGLRDYVNKNGFRSVVLGLSGGIDSAICAPRSPSMRWARNACTRSCCPTATRPRNRSPMPRVAHGCSAAATMSCRSSSRSKVSWTRLSELFEGTNEGSPRRTCRAAPAARS